MGNLRHFPIFLLLAVFSQGYEFDPALPFSEMVGRIEIARHFENKTIFHPLYEEIARETLDLDKFMVLTQQDHLYVDNLLFSFSLLAERETDPGRKEFLRNTSNTSLMWNTYFQKFYDKFNFSKPLEMAPPTLAYSVLQLSSAKNENIGVALATFYPCYVVWAKMGEWIGQIAASLNKTIANHLFGEFITENSGGMNYSVTQNYIALVNGYYERLGDDITTKKKMLESYTQAIQQEYQFATALYQMKRESSPPPNFTDFYDVYSSKHFQDYFLSHPLWIDIAKAQLPIQTYAALIQQDHNFIKGFYKAFEIMEEKENDPVLKEKLNKNSTRLNTWFEQQYNTYQFTESNKTEYYTQEFINHMLTASERSVEEGLASLYPCCILWNKMGGLMNDIADIPNNPGHPYKGFLDLINPLQKGEDSLKWIQELLNGYYNRLGNDIEKKYAMFLAAEQSTLFEVLFANGVYTYRTPPSEKGLIVENVKLLGGEIETTEDYFGIE